MSGQGEGQALFGPTITEITKACKIGFDTHFGSVNVVYFDDYNIPRETSPDRTPDFIHTLEQWFKYFSIKNKTSTLKIEKANGQGFVIALIPISQHKVEKGWFLLYMEKESWKNSSGEYWKDGKRFDVLDGDKVKITKDVGRVDETSIVLNAPKDELHVKILLELIK